MAAPEKDPLTGQYTTGHSWDGIKELRSPVPAWWLSVWIASIAFAVGYVLFYPSFVSLGGYSAGLWRETSRDELKQESEQIRLAQAGLLSRIKSQSVDAIAKDPALASFALAGGRAAFAVNCIACHGAGAGGQIGQFPSLIDDDWIWGGTAAEIEQTIRHGIRGAGDETRTSMMPAFGGMLTVQQIEQVADYVLALNPRSGAGPADLPGAPVYAQNCASCHGDKGQGGREIGAPRLDDAIWLYGGTRQQIMAQVTKPRAGVMPAFGPRLPDETIKALALYVHSLGGGEAAPAAP